MWEMLILDIGPEIFQQRVAKAIPEPLEGFRLTVSRINIRNTQDKCVPTLFLDYFVISRSDV